MGASEPARGGGMISRKMKTRCATAKARHVILWCSQLASWVIFWVKYFFMGSSLGRGSASRPPCTEEFHFSLFW